MTPLEIFRHLKNVDPRCGEAWAALSNLIDERGRKVLAALDDAARNEHRQQILVNILLLRDRKELPILGSDGAVRAYVSVALANEQRDEVRRTKKMRSLDDGFADSQQSPAGAEAASPLPSDPLREAMAVFANLDGLFEHSLLLEPNADRIVRETGWAQIKLLALQPLDVRAVLERTGKLAPGASKADLESTRTGMYKVHERVRAGLLGAIDDLAALGKLDAEAQAELRGQVASLRRRQKRESRASS